MNAPHPSTAQPPEFDAPPASIEPIVVLAGYSGTSPHFAGVAEALAARGARVVRMTELDPGATLFFSRGAAVVVCDCDRESPLCRYALRRAAAAGLKTMLLMDGVLEWRNTFRNPRLKADFLRPAPVDLVACAGERDREILTALGNRAVATGLPRLAGIRPSTSDENGPVLIATARTPTFDRDERARLLDALHRLREALGARGVPVLWRLTGNLDRDLGVTNDIDATLSDALAHCRCLLTTPSTLIVEAMLAGRRAALVHPHPAPLWPLAAAVWRDGQARDPGLGGVVNDAEEAGAREVALDELVDFAISPDEGRLNLQARLARAMHAPQGTGSPAEAVASALLDLLRSEAPARRAAPPTFARLAESPSRRAPNRPRIALMVSCDATPIGGVMTWALRMARVFARDPSLGFDVRVLAVLTDPCAMQPSPDGEPFELNPDGLTSVCQIDPYDDRHVIVETVAESLRRLRPDVVLPGFHDVCWMAAMQARADGARTVGVIHSDEPYYADLLRFYDRWEAGVAVSRRCMERLEPLLASRYGATIPYSVPIAAAPREPQPATAPLQVAYIGRMVRLQKRIFDLFGVIDGLERRGVAYHFHIIGDGADLDEWTAQLRRRRLRTGRVELHGRRDVEWIQAFLPKVDASVLVSDFEGASITMLEAMGHGVVPVVTRIASGVSEWIEDGVNGVTVPIGAPDEMAARLVELHADRALLDRLSHAAWDRVRRDLSPGGIARAWAGVFRAALQAPFDRSPTDLGVRSMENWRWAKQWADDPDGARAWCRGVLHTAGYRRIVEGERQPGCDAVIARSCGGAPDEEQLLSWRERGLGVAQAPLLMQNITERVRRILERAVKDGCRRLVLYGVGRHTRRLPLLFQAGLPIVGLTDDRPPPRPEPTLYGLPIVPFDQVEARLRPDAVLLSSDAFERQMWMRCADLRQRGVRILPVYGTYDDEPRRCEERATAEPIHAAAR